ncbi:hemerythrin domain-containing protein [Microlunatus speluncae]|uniref:hemerythrin domain-containing protein n=1 Tax=Microlunatus speluncae TaxID=2594267 RepID=UPI0012668742|nr:hemerythrin domain-containing protein [Microlunatus speluncae]
MNDQRVTAWYDELQAVHRRLRDGLQVAREAIDSGVEAERLGRDLLIYCWGFCTALDGHHTSEDRALFPLLLKDRPELADVVSKLKQDHSMLSHLIKALTAELNEDADAASLHRHLDGIEAIMETHFGYEERQLRDALGSLPTDGGGRADLFGPIAD